jgi:hypothetical protein
MDSQSSKVIRKVPKALGKIQKGATTLPNIKELSELLDLLHKKNVYHFATDSISLSITPKQHEVDQPLTASPNGRMNRVSSISHWSQEDLNGK